MPDSLLVKFQKLPDLVKARASDPDAMRALDRIEQETGTKLAELVMRVLVREVEPTKIDEVLVAQYNVPKAKSAEVAKMLLDQLFFKFRLLEVPEVPEVKNVAPTLQPQAGASVYLVHPDDAKDVAPHVQQLQTAPAPLAALDPQTVTENIVGMEKLQLDDVLLRRLQKIVESRLVDVRDTAETVEMLLRPVKIGGLGFDEARASRIAGELQRVVEELHRRPKPVIKKVTPPPPPAPKPPVVQPAPPPPAAPKPVAPPAPVPAPKPPVVQPTPPPVVPKAPVTPPATSGPVAPPPWFRPPSVPAAVPAKPQPVLVSKRPAVPSYREVVTDVRAPQKVLGPVEALGSLSIADFRRLGTDPVTRTQKIAEEIEALSRDSFAQRTAGIRAWRQSPTFQSYLEIGRMAMERNEEVSDVIQLLAAQGKPVLSAEEMEAIGALNRQFRF